MKKKELKYSLNFSYIKNIKSLENYSYSYYEEIEAKRWKAIERRQLLIDGLLKSIYDTMSSDKYKIVIPSAGRGQEKILVCGYYKGLLTCLYYSLDHLRLVEFDKDHREFILHALCLSSEELALYAFQRQEDLDPGFLNIIHLRLEKKIPGAIRDDDLVRQYIKVSLLLNRQNRYITSYTSILKHVIESTIQLSYSSVNYHHYDHFGYSPIISLVFSGRRYLYQKDQFIYTPEQDLYTIHKSESGWKLKNIK